MIAMKNDDVNVQNMCFFSFFSFLSFLLSPGYGTSWKRAIFLFFYPPFPISLVFLRFIIFLFSSINLDLHYNLSCTPEIGHMWPWHFFPRLNVSLVRLLVEVQHLLIGLMARKIDTLKMVAWGGKHGPTSLSGFLCITPPPIFTMLVAS